MIVIQIVDWRSYLLRSDIKKHTAFKLPTDITASPKLFHLSVEAKWLWISLIAMATQANKSGFIEQTLDCLEVFTGVNRKTLGASLEALKNAGLIEIDTESVHLSAQIRAESVKLGTQIRAKKESKKTEVIDLTDDELELGRKWLDMAVSEMPHKASDPKWHAAEFGTELKKVGQAVGLDQAGMLKVFHYVSADTFWRPNTCAPKSLLKVNKEGVRKIDNILTRMKKPHERKMEMARESAEDPNRPIVAGGTVTMNILRKFQGLPPIGE
jgi:hypothetical protein